MADILHVTIMPDELHTNKPMVYQITLEGHLGQQWTQWFGNMAIQLQDGGYTLLTGPILDQAALYGLLKKVRDLGLPLVSVIRVEPRRVMRKWPNHKKEKRK